jgi:hypothetical protein
VKAGGQLYMAAGSLLYDEYRTALGADAQLGIARGAFDEFQNVGQDNTMFNLTVKEKVTTADIGDAEVICSRQVLAPMPGGAALATFAGGAPALVSVPSGKGRIIVSGVNLGLAYMKSGSAVREEEQNARFRANAPHTFSAPSYYDAAPRLLLNRIMTGVPFRPAARGDQYLVEANLLIGPKGRVVTLSNYGGKEVTVNLSVTLQPGEKIGKPFVAGGKLQSVKRDGNTLILSITMPETAFAVIPAS